MCRRVFCVTLSSNINFIIILYDDLLGQSYILSWRNIRTFFCRFHTWTNFVPKPKLFLMFNVKLFILCPLRYVIKYIFVISEIFLYMYIYIFNLFLQLFFGYFDTKSAIYILHPSRPIILHIFLRASDGKVLITQKKHQNGCRLFSYKRCM